MIIRWPRWSSMIRWPRWWLLQHDDQAAWMVVPAGWWSSCSDGGTCWMMFRLPGWWYQQDDNQAAWMVVPAGWWSSCLDGGTSKMVIRLPGWWHQQHDDPALWMVVPAGWWSGCLDGGTSSMMIRLSGWWYQQDYDQAAWINICIHALFTCHHTKSPWQHILIITITNTSKPYFQSNRSFNISSSTAIKFKYPMTYYTRGRVYPTNCSYHLIVFVVFQTCHKRSLSCSSWSKSFTTRPS